MSKHTLTDKELDAIRREAWRLGYAAGWKDKQCDFPERFSENPYLDRKAVEECE